jgi:hypothetical protein
LGLVLSAFLFHGFGLPLDDRLSLQSLALQFVGD